MQVNIPALDRKARRKANRAQRQQGGHKLDLTRLQKQAEADTRLRCELAQLIQHGSPSEKVGARKAKRKLNDVWTNRKAQSLHGFWNPTEV